MRAGLALLMLLTACSGKPEPAPPPPAPPLALPPAPHPEPPRDPGPTRRVLAAFRACIAADQSPAQVFDCGCAGDLGRSHLPPPDDPDAYCRHIADATVRYTQAPEETQMKTQMPAAAADVSLPTAVMASMFAACLQGPAFADHHDRESFCLCVADRVSAAAAGRTFASAAEMTSAVQTLAAPAIAACP
jgi:hypothetical protein